MNEGEQHVRSEHENTPQEEARFLRDLADPDAIEKKWRAESGSESRLLTYRERVLLDDVLGLASAIDFHVTEIGQPRIRDGLLEAITSLSARLDSMETEKEKSALTGIIKQLTDSVLPLAESGVTVENCSLAPRPPRSR
jgi:hypothetical protein